MPPMDPDTAIFVLAGLGVVFAAALYFVPEYSLFLAGLASIAFGVYVMTLSKTVFQETEAVIAVIGGGVLVALAKIIRLLKEGLEPEPPPKKPLS